MTNEGDKKVMKAFRVQESVWEKAKHGAWLERKSLAVWLTEAIEEKAEGGWERAETEVK